MNNRKKFEAWAKENYFYVDVKENSWQVWQAATAESVARIAELENALEYLIDACPPIDPSGKEAHERAKAITNTGDKT